MSVEFLNGVYGSTRKGQSTLPHWKSVEYRRRAPTTPQDRIDLWMNVDPRIGKAMAEIYKKRKP